MVTLVLKKQLNNFFILLVWRNCTFGFADYKEIGDRIHSIR